MAAAMVCIFQVFAQILYLEMITFTIVVFACNMPKKEAVLACVIFGLCNMLFMGINPWTLLYVLIYPSYAWLIARLQTYWKCHPLALCLCCGFLSFLCGQLLDLPYLLFGGTITILYLLMGFKTSLIQGILSFLVCLFLYEPLSKRLHKIMRNEEIE